MCPLRKEWKKDTTKKRKLLVDTCPKGGFFSGNFSAPKENTERRYEQREPGTENSVLISSGEASAEEKAIKSVTRRKKPLPKKQVFGGTNFSTHYRLSRNKSTTEGEERESKNKNKICRSGKHTGGHAESNA